MRCHSYPVVAVQRCAECALSWKRDRLDECNTPVRHRKFEQWDQLRGCVAYVDAVTKLRRFTEVGQSVLAVLGPRGTGKTQAACVAIRQRIERYKSAIYVTATELISDLRFEDGGSEKWLRTWGSVSLLVIDEVGNWSGLGDTLQAMRDTLIDHRYAAMRPTVLIGNVKSDTLGECIGDSAVDRTHEGGGIVEFSGWPSFRESDQEAS